MLPLYPYASVILRDILRRCIVIELIETGSVLMETQD